MTLFNETKKIYRIFLFPFQRSHEQLKINVLAVLYLQIYIKLHKVLQSLLILENNIFYSGKWWAKVGLFFASTDSTHTQNGGQKFDMK